MQAEQILKVSPSEPERLFTQDEEETKKLYRTLAVEWHPDRNPDPEATNVFSHLTLLYNEALARIKDDTWKTPGLIKLQAKNGRTYAVQYFKTFPFELGDAYISRSCVTYLVHEEFEDLFRAGIRRMSTLSFHDQRMTEEMSRFLPIIESPSPVIAEKCFVVVLRKDNGLVRLRDLIDHLGGKLDPKHTAWVVSSLYNLCCYLKFAHLMHGDISMDTYYVDPIKHSGALLGGWWYATPIGEAMSALPARTIENIPRDLITNKIAHARVDLFLVKTVGRETLGKVDKSVPESLVQWLLLPTSGDALMDYQTWQEDVLISSFGARRFSKLGINTSDIYGG